ncbi:Lysophospholipid acyltransferase LPEAT1, partial [Cucurbita argyrosperma subsp. argyrosperma]
MPFQNKSQCHFFGVDQLKVPKIAFQKFQALGKVKNEVVENGEILIEDLLKELPVPEKGTTTNGEYLLPFKTGAFLSKAPVLPLILRYPYQRFSLAWESMAGGRHFLLLLCQFVNHLEVIRLPVYVPSQEEKDDPKLYASNIRRFMAKEGNMLLSDIGLPEKRVYLAALNGNNNIRSSHDILQAELLLQVVYVHGMLLPANIIVGFRPFSS